jgi:energy-coupling factor transporter ATP-binding protein EcfA2
MRLIALLPALLIALVMAWVTGMWQFALFAFLSVVSGLLTSSLIKKKTKEPDFDYSDQPIWLSPSAVAIGDRVLPKTGVFFKEQFSDIFFDYLSKLEIAKEVQLQAKLQEENYYRSTKAGTLPFWAGISDGSALEFDLARDGPHALIVGSTGAGKSQLLRLMTGSILSAVPKENIQLVLIDFKGGAALTELSRHPSSLVLVTDIDGSNHERFWNYLTGELTRRELLLAECGLASIEELKDLPRMLVLADELPAIIASHTLAIQALEAIAARGRSLGVHLVATSQSLAGIPRALITNLTLRFALGVTDPGDLIALSPTIRPSELGSGRAIAFCSGKASTFDFPVPKHLPNIGEPKVNQASVDAWSIGLPGEIPGTGEVVGYIDEPSRHSVETIELSSFGLSSVLLVGAAGSGKSMFCKRISEINPNFRVLDCPDLEVLENELGVGRQLFCSIQSSFVLPMSLLRKFEHIIYLKQTNLDQHLACSLPRSQWNEKLTPGRGWYRNKVIQMVMPTLIPELQTQESVPLQPVG